MTNGWDKDIADARQESKVDHGESSDRQDVSDDRMDRADDFANEQRAEATVASSRITSLEDLFAEQKRLEEDARGRRISTRLTYLFLGLMVAVGLLFGAQVLSQMEEDQKRLEKTIAQSEANRREARHQICLRDEREHLEAVEGLADLYRYIGQLKPAELRDTINQFIIMDLPQTEREAATDQAPKFCDEPGFTQEAIYRNTNGRLGSPPVGRPEPDPEIPDRPASVDRIYRQIAGLPPRDGG